MALPSDTVWEVQTTGSDTAAGGGFSTSNKGATGLDLTQGANQAVTTFTANLSAVGTTTLTGVGFSNTMLGNVINITGQGFYCITAFTSSTAVTVDRALGTFAAATGSVGGALASPSIAALQAANGNDIYIKAGTYAISSASTGVAGGCVSPGTGNIRVIGYSTNRTPWNTDTSPLLQIQSGVSSASIIQGQGSFFNLTLDANLQTTARCTSSSGANPFVRCTMKNATASPSGNERFIFCQFTGFTQACVNNNNAFFCEAYGNTGLVYRGGNGGYQWIGCISYGNSSGSGFQPQGAGSILISCTAYNNGGDGFDLSAGTPSAVTCVNCYSEANGGYGFKGSAASPLNYVTLINCGAYNNTSGNTGQTSRMATTGFQSLTTTAFINATSGNFALNSLSGGGAMLRGAGYGTFLRGISVTWPDIGAVQHYLSGPYSPGSPGGPQKNTPYAAFSFPMYNSSGVPTTGLTVSASRRIDAGSFAACANAVTEVSSGWYSLDLAASDLAGNTIALRFSAAGAVDTDLAIYPHS
jgi:hypothetical protein